MPVWSCLAGGVLQSSPCESPRTPTTPAVSIPVRRLHQVGPVMPRRGGTLTPSQPPVDRDPDTVHVIVIPLSQDQSQSTTHRPGSWCLGLSNIPDIYLKFRQRSLMIVPILVFLDVALKGRTFLPFWPEKCIISNGFLIIKFLLKDYGSEYKDQAIGHRLSCNSSQCTYSLISLWKDNILCR